MKRPAWVLFLFLVFGMAPAAWAGPAEEAAQMAEQWMKAFHEGNAEALSALYAPDAVYYSSFSPFRVEGREAIRALFAGVFRPFPTRALVKRHFAVRVYDGAMIRNYYWTLTWGNSSKGNLKTYHGRSSIVYMEVQGRRMIVDHHTSLLPVSQ